MHLLCSALSGPPHPCLDAAWPTPSTASLILLRLRGPPSPYTLPLREGFLRSLATPLSVSICFSLLVSFCLCLSVSLYLCFSVSISVSLCFCLYFSASLSVLSSYQDVWLSLPPSCIPGMWNGAQGKVGAR